MICDRKLTKAVLANIIFENGRVNTYSNLRIYELNNDMISHLSDINSLIFEYRSSKINEFGIRLALNTYPDLRTNNTMIVKSDINPLVFENRRSKVNEIPNPIRKLTKSEVQSVTANWIFENQVLNTYSIYEQR